MFLMLNLLLRACALLKPLQTILLAFPDTLINLMEALQTLVFWLETVSIVHQDMSKILQVEFASLLKLLNQANHPPLHLP